MSFADFAGSHKGEFIKSILCDPASIRRMEALSAAGRPALLAVAGTIERAKLPLTDTEKQHVGRWVHRVLGPRGWRPVDKKRMPPGSLFTTAAVYERVAGAAAENAGPSRVLRPAAARAPASRIEAARERARALPVKPQSVRAFIAEKRSAAKRER